MEQLLSLVERFTSYPGISGFETMAFDGMIEEIKKLNIFDEIGTTAVGSIYAKINCGKENAETILCDAHLDTVGFVVTEICDGGFLRVAPVGGIAPKILPSAEVNIYGKETIRGIFSSTPPHLQTDSESEKKMDVSDMSIDTGLSVEELEKIVRVGTPVGFVCKLQKLFGDTLVGCSFDDRLCGAVIIRALMMIDKSKLNVNIAFQFSGNEETGYKGAMTTAYRLNPSRAIVVDVTHAFVPGAPKVREGIRAGNGTDICFSPQTSRAFTNHAVSVAEREGIPYQLSAAPVRTGTNSNAVQTTRNGIPTVLLSIPLKNMHTMSEIVDMNDSLNTSKLIAAILKSL